MSWIERTLEENFFEQKRSVASVVTVSLTGASQKDAATVFGVLGKAFPAGDSWDVPLDLPGGNPVVWTAEFEPTESRVFVPTGPTPLEDSLTVTLQGGYVAVDRLRDALSAAFAVNEQGTVSGDQEKEVDLELRTKRQ
ncbi:hypothetical protein ABZV34_32450 [Streptomyces sp. NPDC005195]|uniref:hypothetical protein n=1 Tax=Streptomyces sp. NPDC005195 TaxID=3154561 RepID=UPI0033BA47F8